MEKKDGIEDTTIVPTGVLIPVTKFDIRRLPASKEKPSEPSSKQPSYLHLLKGKLLYLLSKIHLF